MRAWYTNAAGKLKPSSKGVSIRFDQIPEIARGLTLASMTIDPKGNA
jgi:Transcriptional Coactivator p15 (PC4)